MNQLTVMLNGQAQAAGAPNQLFFGTPHHHHQQQQHGSISLDPNQHPHQQQLITYHHQQQPPTMAPQMILNSQAAAYPTGAFQQQNPGAIQYFIQQPSLQQQQMQLTQSQPFGIVQNILPPGATMIPVAQPQQQQQSQAQQQQSLATAAGTTNGTTTIQIPANLMAPNGGFVTMAANQQPQQIQIQQQQHPNPQLNGSQLFQNGAASFQFQTTQSQLQPTNSAITFQPQPQQQQQQQQIIQTANGQFITLTTNQPMYQNPSPMPSQPQVYQLVLPNGQVIQTVQQQQPQPQAPQNLISHPQPQPQFTQQQPSAITVPIHNQNFLGSPGLSLGQTTFITQQQPTAAAAAQQQQQHQQTTPNLINQSPTLVIPTSGHQQQQQFTQPQILLSPIPHQSQQPLLIPAATNQQAIPNGTNSSTTTAMVVLTQANNMAQSSGIPTSVLDHKSSHSSPRQTLVLLTSPRLSQKPAKSSPGAILLTKPNSGVVPNGQETTSGAGQTNAAAAAAAPDPATAMPKVKPKPIDQGTQCDDNPQIAQMLDQIDRQEAADRELALERPSRPSSTSSCGSLKIAEDVEEEEEEEEEEETQDTDTVNNDALSTETELDNQSLDSESNHRRLSNPATPKDADETTPTKEGYQSSLESPCHFTDTEDEEEEETMMNPLEQGVEIKLTHRNGLTKAGFDLINNRLESDDPTHDMDGTNDSETRGSSNGTTTGERDEEMNEELSELTGDESSMNQDRSLAPSPNGSAASSGPMEPESTTGTSNWKQSNKETTISSIKERFYAGIDLDPIREFAMYFKRQRTLLGLTQSHVCRDLHDRSEGQSYSQSAICRFEKLDTTPKSAVKIKPVLESWLKWADKKYQNNKLANSISTAEMNASLGSSSNEGKLLPTIPENGRLSFAQLREVHSSAPNSEDESISSYNCGISLEPGKKRKKRTSFTPEQLESLNQYFERNSKPSSEEMTQIAHDLGSCDPKINRDVVRVWFCNKRQALKAKRCSVGSPLESGGGHSPTFKPLTRPENASSSVSTTTTTSSTYPSSIQIQSTEPPKPLAAFPQLTFPTYPTPVSAIPLALTTNPQAAVPNSVKSSSSSSSPLPLPLNLVNHPQPQGGNKSATGSTSKQPSAVQPNNSGTSGGSGPKAS